MDTHIRGGRIPGTIRSALLMICVLGLSAQSVSAHKKRSSRKALVTAKLDGEATRLEVMVFLRVAGPRAQSWLGRYDLDGSRTFDPAESRLLGDALGPQAIGGLQVLQGQGAIIPQGVQTKARLGDGDAVEVAVFLIYPAKPEMPLAFEVRDVDAKGTSPHGPLFVEFSALPPLAVKRSTVPVQGKVISPFRLESGKGGLKVFLAHEGSSVKAADLLRDP